MKRNFEQTLGLLGIVSLLSYTAAVVFSPLAFPGYDWISQAVSDLSAETAPSRALWKQLSALYMPCGIVCCTLCCGQIKGRCDRPVRLGVYLFAAMNWLSAVGYSMFPLTGAGQTEGAQNVMHMAVTVGVVLLSVASLALIIAGGIFRRACPSLGIWAAVCLLFMLLGAVGTGALPGEYFGIPERFSVFAATGFNAVLGVYMFRGFPQSNSIQQKKSRVSG